MGIHGIYKEIGPGQRIALSKLAADAFTKHKRPLRLAIDTSIWLFQIQASKGGTNPALRTFYYRLIRLLSLAIHPVFVFDGDNKPPFKRNKRTGANVASIPEYFAKDLLKWFGFSVHEAPGEAEAECALLQREGIVDAVLSEDVDTLMFGSGTTIRLWTAEGKGKVPTHVSLYDAETTKNGTSGLDCDGMILVALMSGGDYIPEGLPGCGPKVACEAARAGFGRELCSMNRRDKAALKEWRERLVHELRTNESKFFKRKPRKFDVPDNFPSMEILGYYMQPAVSSKETIDGLKKCLDHISRCASAEDLERYWNTLQDQTSQKLRYSLRSFFERPIDFDKLRTFTRDGFKWQYLDDAKHFIRTMYPAALVREIRLNNLEHIGTVVDSKSEQAAVKALLGSRAHPVTDNCTELRVECIPEKLVPIDLSKEEATSAFQRDVGTEDEAELGDEDAPKGRGPTLFNPNAPQRVWVHEVYVQHGLPDLYDGFQNTLRMKAIEKEDKERRQAARKAASTAPKGVQAGSLDRFTRVTKSGQPGPSLRSAKSPTPQPASTAPAVSEIPHAQSETQAPRTRATTKRRDAIPATQPARSTDLRPVANFRVPPSLSFLAEREDTGAAFMATRTNVSSSNRHLGEDSFDYPPSSQPQVTKRGKRSPFSRSETLPVGIGTGISNTTPQSEEIDGLDAFTTLMQSAKDDSALEVRSPFRKRRKTASSQRGSKEPPTPRKAKGADVIDLISPSPKKQTSISSFVTRSSPRKDKEDDGHDDMRRGHDSFLDDWLESAGGRQKGLGDIEHDGSRRFWPENQKLHDDAGLQRLDLTDSPRSARAKARANRLQEGSASEAMIIHSDAVARVNLTGIVQPPSLRAPASSLSSRRSLAELKDGNIPQSKAQIAGYGAQTEGEPATKAQDKQEIVAPRAKKKQTHVLVKDDGSWEWGTNGVRVEIIDLTKVN
ncbi:hypothetical protein P152DRAFT_480979 [Eremomyces bilateralis CBS 781.70]|uniref:PIN domain-like protein n=1 Tax=Eremomyces bilateralis CBS 781.70 TaxID=1392243 RepID=A0A6G1G7E3_9PEZI|nr:uncharacterized protein P152DRAFT_480979 [Eremomyces bilateralis CBS 781.70]KAF1813759.1 hypothetical protein P152DRAFT_480979 [Eremomyces bilateralis CBS 781.70]